MINKLGRRDWAEKLWPISGNFRKKRMSRIGNLPIQIPEQVKVEIQDREVVVSGPLGSLSLNVHPAIEVETKDGVVLAKPKVLNLESRALHGLTRSLIANMVIGVSRGWEKKLELVGVGYRAQLNGDKLVLNVGYSHPVEIVSPAGVKFAVSDNTKISVSGFDKQLIGQVAASIRKVKPPEPYQGKGIRFAGEYVKRKAGKAGKIGVGK